MVTQSSDDDLVFFFLIKSNLVKITMHFSSQIFPMEMREPVVGLLKTWVYCALGESLVDIFKVDRRSRLMMLLLATWTVGPDMVRTMWEQCGKASG